MRHKLKSHSPNTWRNKIVFTVLAFIIVLDLIFVLLFFTMERGTTSDEQHERDVQKVMSVIYAAQESKNGLPKHFIKAIQTKNFLVKVTPQPLWEIQFKAGQFWSIYEDLKQSQSKRYLQLSYQLPSNQWLNINMDTTPGIPWLAWITLLVELVLVIVIISYAWAMHKFNKPLVKIKQAADQLGVNLEAKTIPVGPGMAKDTINAMNRMQERIVQLVTERVATLAALSHDLRTPLTRAQLQLQLLDESPRQQKIMESLHEIEFLINESLSYAKQDFRHERSASFDIVKLLDKTCQEAKELGGKVTFKHDVDELNIKGQMSNLKRVFMNLVQNAVKYGEKAEVYLFDEGDVVCIEVRDQGEGLPEEQLEKVFEAFHRHETSRNRDTGGTGLGLSICQAIVKNHKGHISLKNMEPKGLCAQVILPKS